MISSEDSIDLRDREQINAREFDASMLRDDMSQFAEVMLDSTEIPNEEKARNWGFFGRDAILTRSDGKNDMFEAANDIAIMHNTRLMAEPYYKHTPDRMVDEENTRRRIMSQHKRSLGGFERNSLTTSVRELRTVRPEPVGSGGIWGGLKKKLGLGPKEQDPYASS